MRVRGSWPVARLTLHTVDWKWGGHCGKAGRVALGGRGYTPQPTWEGWLSFTPAKVSAERGDCKEAEQGDCKEVGQHAAEPPTRPDQVRNSRGKVV